MQTNTLHPEKYRKDIDGLRAVAVGLVVGFHAFPGWIKGGFIGVDIFFVISGYLISGILLERLKNGDFSLKDFYGRRIRRIFPALCIVLIASLVAGFCFLENSALEKFIQSVAAGSWFISNLKEWSLDGYFNVEAIQKPLLHLWSLGVEEQFYFLWPVILAAAFRLNKAVLVTILSIGIASYTANILTIDQDPTGAFYSPLTRFWELLIGAGLMYWEKNQTDSVKSVAAANAKCLIALALLILGLSRINSSSHFPGSWALLPTVSAALFISAGSHAWLNKYILSNKLMVWGGIISFPLYLWHWPILSFLSIYTPSPNMAFRCIAVLASVVLAWCTYLIIERPARFGKYSFNLSALYFSTTLIIGVIAVAWPSIPDFRLSPDQRATKKKLLSSLDTENHLAEMYGDRSCFRFLKSQGAEMFISNGCVEKKNPKNKTIFLIGDSHSASLSLGLRPLIESKNINFLQVSTGWCEPTNDDERNTKCTEINNLALDAIKKEKPDLVIFNSLWIAASGPAYFISRGDYEETLISFISKLMELGAKRVLVVGQIPTWYPSLPEVMIKRYLDHGINIPERSKFMTTESIDLDKKMREYKYPSNSIYLSVKDFLCNVNGCITMIGTGTEVEPIVWDYGHLTERGSKFVADKLLYLEIEKLNLFSN